MENDTTTPTPTEFLAIWEIELADAKADDDGSYASTARVRRASIWAERARRALAQRDAGLRKAALA